jgi:hypothetical protein
VKINLVRIHIHQTQAEYIGMVISQKVQAISVKANQIQAQVD